LYVSFFSPHSFSLMDAHPTVPWSVEGGKLLLIDEQKCAALVEAAAWRIGIAPACDR